VDVLEESEKCNILISKENFYEKNINNCYPSGFSVFVADDLYGTRRHKRELVSNLIAEFVSGKHGSFIRKLKSVFYRRFVSVELRHHE
jgi:hypothetical protein